MTQKLAPPFNAETVGAKVKAAENAWNTRDPQIVAQAYSENSEWRNRNKFFTGRDAIKAFLTRKWAKELHYLVKELWAYTDNHISVRFEYEWQDATSGQWSRTHGNEHWEFDDDAGFRLRDWVVHPREHTIVGPDGTVHVPPKEMAVLSCLARQAGKVVTRQELMEEVWRNVYVTDDALSRAVSLLRTHLGDRTDQPMYIHTVPKKGYKLVAAVGPLDPAPATPLSDSPIDLSASDGHADPSVESPWRWSRTLWGAALAVVVGCIVYFVDDRTGFLRNGEILDTSGPQAVETHDVNKPASTAADRPSRFSIAVLPLDDLKGEDLAFADGIADYLVIQLAHRPPLQVTSWTSSRRYRQTSKALPVIAEELGVRYVLEASVARRGEHVRVGVNLVDALRDRSIWADVFEGDIKGIWKLEDTIVRRAAESVLGTMVPTTMSANPYELSPLAYEAYMKGGYFRSLLTEDGVKKAQEYFQETIDRAPEFAPGYVGLASCYCILGGTGLETSPPTEVIPRSQALLKRAEALDSTRAEIYALQALNALKYEWNPGKAEALMDRALTLNPSFASGHLWRSQILEAKAAFNEAIGSAERARQLDPLSVEAHINLGWQLYRAERLIEASVQYEKALELAPDNWAVHLAYGYYYLASNMLEAAIKSFRKADELTGGHVLPKAALGYVYSIKGETHRAIKVIEALMLEGESTYVSPYWIALVYAGMGDEKAMLEWLQKAYDARSKSLAWLAVAREFDPYRDMPEFQAFFEKVRQTGGQKGS